MAALLIQYMRSAKMADLTIDEALELAKQGLLELDAALQEEAPDLNVWMTKLNTNLRQFPELIHLLSDEQRAPLYRAIIKVSQIKVAPPEKIPKEKKPKKTKEVKDFLSTEFNLSSLDLSGF